jgi:capsular polysaccharide transport system permease protein
VAGAHDSFSEKASEYARLQLDAQFTEKELASAMAALESARKEAERKQLYLEELVQPNVPDEAIEPKRLRGIATVFALGLVTWGLLSLLLASIREHRD